MDKVKKDVVITFRITYDEHEKLKTMTTPDILTVSGVLRKILRDALNPPVAPPVPEVKRIPRVIHPVQSVIVNSVPDIETTIENEEEELTIGKKEVVEESEDDILSRPGLVVPPPRLDPEISSGGSMLRRSKYSEQEITAARRARHRGLPYNPDIEPFIDRT